MYLLEKLDHIDGKHYSICLLPPHVLSAHVHNHEVWYEFYA